MASPSAFKVDKRPSTPVTGMLTGNVRLPSSATSAASVGLSSHEDDPGSPTRLRLPSTRPAGNLVRSTSTQTFKPEDQRVYLEIQDGEVYEGISFGAPKSAAGELVFQTGMVGYPESLTDPSYRGQILVITFPLVGNYGVPSRTVMDELLRDLPKYFESSQIHVAGLVTASYSGEDYSHYLAKSSLGSWLKENDVPAMYGVDTRALTKRIRQQGSMLGRMLHQKASVTNGRPNGVANGQAMSERVPEIFDWRVETNIVDWIDQNTINLVSEGESLFQAPLGVCGSDLTAFQFRSKNPG
jgi:carbamoyl-phosphate synthase/aspartate carbamoyltransferase